MRYTNSTDAYYAIVEVKSKVRNGVTGQVVDCVVRDRIGPYSKPAPAKAAVTSQRKTRGSQFIDGWVEISTGWERLED